MKAAVNIVILLFVIFLATPTVVTVIKDSRSTTAFYGMNEEEETSMKDIKEIKASLKLADSPFISFPLVSSTSLISTNLQLKHDKISASIFVPPPNV